MKKVIVLRHQNEMKVSREFFQMEIPKELSRTIYVIVTICLIIFSVMIFGRIDDVIRTNGFVRTKENVSSVRTNPFVLITSSIRPKIITEKIIKQIVTIT